MKKKVIGLSILLLVLLLGLSTITYAYEYEITNENIDELMSYYNNVTWFNSISASTINSRLKTSLNNNQSNYDNCLIYIYTTSNGRYVPYIYYFNNNTVSAVQWSSVSNFRITCTTYEYSVVDNKYRTISAIQSDSRGKYVMWRNDIGNYKEGPYQNIQIMTIIEPQAPFSFVSETGLGIVTYNNYEYTLFEKPSSGDLLLGQLFIPNGVTVNYQDIINYYWRWNNWQSRELATSNIYLQLISNDDGDLSFNVKLKSDYIYPNTYYQYIWSDHTTEPYQISDGGCYIKDPHTVIVNGVVDPYQTFSGDYADEYNNELENMDFQQNLQDQTDQLLDSSEVDSILGGFSSSGDILDAFGYSPIENPFVVVIRNVFVGLNDVLLGSGNQTLDLSSFGMQLVLHSEDFVLPDNIITTFIHLVCNGFFVYGLYKYGFKLIQWINTGRLQNLLDETSGSTNYLF